VAVGAGKVGVVADGGTSSMEGLVSASESEVVEAGEGSRLVSCETETPMAIDASMINNKASPHCPVSRLAGE
jgi:hypothetical protein